MRIKQHQGQRRCCVHNGWLVTARRVLELNDEIADLNQLIEPLVNELAPALLELLGVGVESAGEFLVAAGDNPDRLT